MHQIIHFLPQNYLPLEWGWGIKLTTSCLLTLQMTHTEFGQDWLSSSWKEDVNGRRTTDDHGWPRTPTHSNRSPEWLRLPKMFIICFSKYLNAYRYVVSVFRSWWNSWTNIPYNCIYYSASLNAQVILM